MTYGFFTYGQPKARPAKRRRHYLDDNAAHNAHLLAHQIRVSGGTTFADPPRIRDDAGSGFDAIIAALEDVSDGMFMEADLDD